jgi:hypothetical protein
MLVVVLYAVSLLKGKGFIMSPFVLLVFMGVVVLIGIPLRVAAGIRHLLDFLHTRLYLPHLRIPVALPEKEEIIIAVLLVEVINALNQHVLLADLLQRFLQQGIDFIWSKRLLRVGWRFLDWLGIVSWLFLWLGDARGEAD